MNPNGKEPKGAYSRGATMAWKQSKKPNQTKERAYSWRSKSNTNEKKNNKNQQQRIITRGLSWAPGGEGGPGS